MATIQFSDGSTTIDLTGATGDYALMYDSWSPKVAKRRVSTMGGRSPYEDVRETMQIKIKGTSETDCLANLTTLSELFDQANAWGRGENVTAVEIQYQHTGSSTQVDAVIWDAEIMPPTNFTWMGTIDDDVIYPVTLSFLRRGLWFGSTEAETSGNSTGNPAVVTVSSTFTDDANILMPYDFQLTFTASGTYANSLYGYIAVANAAAKIYFDEAESADTNGFDTASHADTTASNGAVSKGNPDTASKVLQYNTIGMTSGVRKFALFASVQNLSTSGGNNISWFVQAGPGDSNSGLKWYTRKTIISAEATSASKVISLGIVSVSIDIDRLFLKAGSLTNGTNGTDDLEVDWVCMVGIDDSTQILYFDMTPDNPASATLDRIKVEHLLASELTPTVQAYDSATFAFPPSYNGNAIFSSAGNSLSAIVMGKRESRWRIDDSTPTEMSYGFTATRTISYLTPP